MIDVKEEKNIYLSNFARFEKESTADGQLWVHRLRKAAMKRFTELGYGRLPVCMAKTQSSLSDDAKKLGRPRGFTVTIRDAKVAAGAGFVVAYAGDILTMPGLPKVPAAEAIDLDEHGNVVGLF